jgi:hypothetical protein
MSKVTISVPKLKSKNATFVALINECIMWAEENEIEPQQMQHLIDGFRRYNQPRMLEDIMNARKGL